MTEIYTFDTFLTAMFFDILPNDKKSPRGSENINVSANIYTEISIPDPSWDIMTEKSIPYLHIHKNRGRYKMRLPESDYSPKVQTS